MYDFLKYHFEKGGLLSAAFIQTLTFHVRK